MTLLYKFIYHPFVNSILRPLAKLIYNLTGKKIITISGILPVSVYGVNFKLITNQTCSVTQELFFNGPENYEFSPFFNSLIKQSKVFFDVGANIGYFTVLAGKLNPNVSIFAFEPSFGPSHYVEENIRLNKLTNATLIKKAVAEIDGTLTFHDVVISKYNWVKHNLNGSNSLQNSFGLDKSMSYPVEVTTLETVINDNNLTRLDILKLDTECTEHLILACSKETIRKLEPIIFCEVYDLFSNETQQIIDDLIGYQIFQIHGEQLKKINSLVEGTKDNIYRNYVFCPKGKLSQLEQFIQ